LIRVVPARPAHTAEDSKTGDGERTNGEHKFKSVFYLARFVPLAAPGVDSRKFSEVIAIGSLFKIPWFIPE
jgi:hypothetical protein